MVGEAAGAEGDGVLPVPAPAVFAADEKTPMAGRVVDSAGGWAGRGFRSAEGLRRRDGRGGQEGKGELTRLAVVEAVLVDLLEICACRARLARAVADAVGEVLLGTQAGRCGLAIVHRGAADGWADTDHIVDAGLLGKP